LQENDPHPPVRRAPGSSNKRARAMLKGLFFGTATLVVLTHLLRDPLGLVRWNLGLPVLVGFWGYFLISMIDYTASFFAAVRVAEQVEQAVPTGAQRQKVTEAILIGAIEGHAPTPEPVTRALDWPLAVSLGLLAGSALAWAGELLLSLLPDG
jgi:hypothetical protein